MASMEGQLCRAAEEGDLQRLLACLAAGADPNAPLPFTSLFVGLPPAKPLHLVCLNGHAGCVAALLAAGADPNAEAPAGLRPLDYAASHGHADCVQLLVEGGADPNAPAVAGRTPLIEAATNGDSACMAALLAGGADPAAADSSGWTAAHFAALTDNVGPLSLLLAAQPDLARTAGAASLPLALALGCDHLEAARCLLERGTLPPAGQVLALLNKHHPAASVHPLFAILAGRTPLTAAEWALVPAPCPGIGAALPAVLERSTAEAALLVPHLPLAERHSLRTAALCLARVQRVHDVQLPASFFEHLLAQAMSDTQMPNDE